jgi:hypothetical protein
MTTEAIQAGALPGFELTTTRQLRIGDDIAPWDATDDRDVATVHAASASWGSNGDRVNLCVAPAGGGCSKSSVAGGSDRVQRRLIDPADATAARIRAGIIRMYDVPVPPWWTLAGQAHRADARMAAAIDRGRPARAVEVRRALVGAVVLVLFAGGSLGGLMAGLAWLLS